MLDQDTARALLTMADEMGARVALVGDRHQLPAVGRGGVLDLAARWVRPEATRRPRRRAPVRRPRVRRLSLALRTGEHGPGTVFDAAACERGQVGPCYAEPTTRQRSRCCSRS